MCKEDSIHQSGLYVFVEIKRIIDVSHGARNPLHELCIYTVILLGRILLLRKYYSIINIELEYRQVNGSIADNNRKERNYGKELLKWRNSALLATNICWLDFAFHADHEHAKIRKNLQQRYLHTHTHWDTISLL